MIHRFPRFHSTESLCDLSYGQVCRLNHAYVIVEHDAHRVDCPNCVGIQSSSRAPQLADKRAAPMGVGCNGTPAFGAAVGDEAMPAAALDRPNASEAA